MFADHRESAQIVLDPQEGGTVQVEQRRQLLGAALATGLVTGCLSLGALVWAPPIELSELAAPSRVYARPHRLAGGQDMESSGLLARLARLGYRQIQSGTPRPGEYRRDRAQIELHRRAFRTPLASGEDRDVLLRVSSGRIESIRGVDGERIPSLLLEPEVVGELHSSLRESRELLALEEVPADLVTAILTLEDRRFQAHGGLDLQRMVGASWANLRAGRIVQGGSTLTQQLVKNVYLTDERTFGRKLQEAWLARRVERGNSKHKILETYLNTIYLGQRRAVSIRGVEAAARHYFGISARDLTLGQSALIAGLVRGPGLYSPFRSKDAALKRRNDVLGFLFQAGAITEERMRAALEEPLGALEAPPGPVTAPWFTAWVTRELEAALPDTDLERAGLAVTTGLDASLQEIAEQAVTQGLDRLEKDFPKLRREDGRVQAALVALDPHSGDVLALVGGRDWAASQFDRVTQARRQPGSLFKPIVALAALEPGPDGHPAFTLASRLEDSPLQVRTVMGPWKPGNYDGEFRGEMTLRDALELSINVPFARLGIEIGPQRIVDAARRLGIESRLDPVPSLALGAYEVTPLEIATAYSTLAAGGEYRAPRPFAQVLRADGTPLLVREVATRVAYDPAQVALVTSALRGAVERGTARGIRSAGFLGPVAGKTGTTNDAHDAWFAGYTPDVTVVVWVGFDSNASLGLTGAQAALPIFTQFLRRALGPDGGSDFLTPPGVEFVEIDPVSGLRATWACPGVTEVFLSDSSPRDSCVRWAERERPERTTRRRPADGPVVSSPRKPQPEPVISRFLRAVLDALNPQNSN